jgi:hypothetical protein
MSKGLKRFQGQARACKSMHNSWVCALHKIRLIEVAMFAFADSGKLICWNRRVQTLKKLCEVQIQECID